MSIPTWSCNKVDSCTHSIQALMIGIVENVAKIVDK